MQHSNLNSYIQKSDSTIFLGNLLFQTTFTIQNITQQIKKSFENSFAIQNIRVYEKKGNYDTKKYYAFVIFSTSQQAKKALLKKTLIINSNKIQIQKYFVQRQYQIYIRDVGLLTRSQIEQQFSRFGNIDNIHIDTTHSKIISCSIKFVNVQDAAKCLNSEQILIKNKKIRVQKYIDHNKEQKQENNKLIIKRIELNLDKKLIENQLNKQLKKFGNVQKIQFKQGKNFRSVIVLYQNQKNVKNALNQFNKNLFSNQKTLQIQPFTINKDRNNKNTLFINNLRHQLTQKQFIQAFSIYGKIQNISFYKVQNRNQKLQRGTLSYVQKQSWTQLLINSSNQPKIFTLFINKTPKINVYQDKIERSQFKKTFKKNISTNPIPQITHPPPPNFLPDMNMGFGQPRYPNLMPFNPMMPQQLQIHVSGNIPQMMNNQNYLNQNLFRK